MADGAGGIVGVVTLLGVAVVAVPLFKRLGLGSVLGYLAAGLLVGPFGLGLFVHPEAIIHLAEFGVVMFLFIIGLEMKPQHLWSLRRQIFGLGAGQVLTAITVLTLVGMLFGFDWRVSFVGAAGFVMTSTAIVMQVLGEKGELASSSGQKMVSILLFEDLLIVPLLALVAFLAPPETVAAPSEHGIVYEIALALGSLAGLFVVGRFVLNPLFGILAKAKAREVMTAAALLVVLGSALLMEAGGLSMAMGAFVAGVLLSESSYRHQLEADIEPFRGLLLGLFFLGVGMSLDLAVVAKNLGLIVGGVLALMLAKAVCIFIVAKLTKSDNREALQRSVLMAQGGEFAFVLFAAAAAQKVISPEIHANMTAVVVFSMVLTPLCLIVFEKWLLPRLAKTGAVRADDAIEAHKPVIVVGMGRFGQIVADILLMSGQELTIIDKNPVMVDGMTAYGVKTHYGDASRPEILHAAGIENARMLIVAIDDKAQAVQIVQFAKSTNPDITVIARAFDRIHTYDLYQAGADDIIRETFDSAVRAGKSALTASGMDKVKAGEVADLFFRRDRDMLIKMVEHYDPNAGLFQNKTMMQASQKHDADTRKMIQALINDEVVLWNNDESDDAG